MAVVDPTQYTLVPFTVYNTLQERLQALSDGEVLLIKKFEQKSKADVLIQLVEKKYTVTQISYDTKANDLDERYWITFNVGINDLSLLTAFQFDESAFSHENKYMVNDIVTYTSEDGFEDSAIIEEVYVSNIDPNQYAYKLSRDPNGIYAEESLIKHRYL